MKNEAVIHEILKQSLSAVDGDAAPGKPGYAETAEKLGDEIYRLCIEFGMPFNTCKSAVLDEVLDRSQSPRSEGASSSRRASFLDAFESCLPLVVFALDLMREDEAF